MERLMELYSEVYRDLCRLAYYYLGNAEDAEDAVQDTALAAYEHFPGLKQKASFRPWIFRILVNHCRRCLKKRKRTMYVPEDALEVCGLETADLSLQTQVLELLSVLKEEERLIVVLTVFGGYKGQEIARLLKKKHSTIRSKYRRALKKLEQELSKEPKGKEMRR